MNNLEFKATAANIQSHNHQRKYQLINMFLSTSRYKFSLTSMRILEAELDLLSDFTNLIEKLFYDNLDIEIGRIKICEIASELLENQIESLKTVPEVDTRLMLIYLALKEMYIEVLLNRIRRLVQVDRSNSFTQVSNFMCNYVDHVALVLTEIDYLTGWQQKGDSYDPFITLDQLDLVVSRDIDKKFVIERLNFYKENGLLRGTHICVKSYINAERLESNSSLNDVYEMTLDEIEKSGFKIVCIF